LVLVLAFRWRGPDPVPPPYLHTVAAVGFGLILSASIFAPAETAGRILGSRVPALLGLISYSLYLWHEPVTLFLHDRGWYPDPGAPYSFLLGVLVLVPVAGLVAWLSYWIIEYPCGKLRRSRDHRGEAREYYRRRRSLVRRSAARRFGDKG
jgi:peptidoglycan/LPS O-acetylase OafA/YrhL